MLAVADKGANWAGQVARGFGQRLWRLRDQILPDGSDTDGALDRVGLGGDKSTVLADFADNASDGAPADSTFVLDRVLARGLRDITLGIFWDPGLSSLARTQAQVHSYPCIWATKSGQCQATRLTLT